MNETFKDRVLIGQNQRQQAGVAADRHLNRQLTAG